VVRLTHQFRHDTLWRQHWRRHWRAVACPRQPHACRRAEERCCGFACTCPANHKVRRRSYRSMCWPPWIVCLVIEASWAETPAQVLSAVTAVSATGHASATDDTPVRAPLGHQCRGVWWFACPSRCPAYHQVRPLLKPLLLNAHTLDFC
jgi:hypothetical protein